MECLTENPWQKHQERLLQKLEINQNNGIGKMVINKEDKRGKKKV